MTRASREAVGERADAVYKFIVDYFREHGIMPSVRDFIKHNVGEGTTAGPITSTNIVNGYLDRLDKDGRIELIRNQWHEQKARGIRLPDARFVQMPEEDWRFLKALLNRAYLFAPMNLPPGAQAQIDRIRPALFGEDGEE